MTGLLGAKTGCIVRVGKRILESLDVLSEEELGCGVEGKAGDQVLKEQDEKQRIKSGTRGLAWKSTACPDLRRSLRTSTAWLA